MRRERKILEKGVSFCDADISQIMKMRKKLFVVVRKGNLQIPKKISNNFLNF